MLPLDESVHRSPEFCFGKCYLEAAPGNVEEELTGQRCRDAGVQGCRDVGVQGHRDAVMKEYRDTGMQARRDAGMMQVVMGGVQGSLTLYGSATQ